jgi:DNA-binding transcriptional ArsR family regulator
MHMVIDDVFAVIAESTRRRILRSLHDGDKAVGELVEELDVSQPTVSKHLKVLREAGLVSMRAQGQKRFYSLVAAPLEAVAEWVLAFGLGSAAAQERVPAGVQAATVPAAGVPAVLPAAALPDGPAAAALPDGAAGAHRPAAVVAAADRPAVRTRTLGQAADRAANKAADFLANLSKPNLPNLPPLRRRKKG